MNVYVCVCVNFNQKYEGAKIYHLQESGFQ